MSSLTRRTWLGQLSAALLAWVGLGRSSPDCAPCHFLEG
jgi:hypothetical protein